jgi:hypothetical protein
MRSGVKHLFGKKSERFMSRWDSPGMLRWDEELETIRSDGQDERSTRSDCGRSTNSICSNTECRMSPVF